MQFEKLHIERNLFRISSCESNISRANCIRAYRAPRAVHYFLFSSIILLDISLCALSILIIASVLGTAGFVRSIFSTSIFGVAVCSLNVLLSLFSVLACCFKEAAAWLSFVNSSKRLFFCISRP